MQSLFILFVGPHLLKSALFLCCVVGGVCSHVNEFFGADRDGEKSHKVHQLFQEYEQLFEAIVEDFLSSEQVLELFPSCSWPISVLLRRLIPHSYGDKLNQQLSGQEFFQHCRSILQNPRHEDASTNLQIVLSALDFDAFCDLMEVEAIQTQQALKAAEDMGL